MALMVMLELLEGDGAGLTFQVVPDGGIIGRDPMCTVHLNNVKVSSRHAELKWMNERWLIRDLHSKNGTFLDNQRVAYDLVVLAPEGELRIADERFKYVCREYRAPKFEFQDLLSPPTLVQSGAQRGSKEDLANYGEHAPLSPSIDRRKQGSASSLEEMPSLSPAAQQLIKNTRPEDLFDLFSLDDSVHFQSTPPGNSADRAGSGAGFQPPSYPRTPQVPTAEIPPVAPTEGRGLPPVGPTPAMGKRPEYERETARLQRNNFAPPQKVATTLSGREGEFEPGALEALRKESAALLQREKEQTQTLEALRQELAEVQQREAEAVRSLEALRRDSAGYKQREADAIRALEALRQETSGFRQHDADTGQALEVLRRENADLKQREGEAGRTVEGLRRENAGLKQREAEAGRMIEGLGRENAGLKQRDAEAARMIDGLGRENAGLKQRDAEAARVIDGLRRENAGLKQRDVEMSRALEGLHNDTQAQAQMINELRRLLEEAQMAQRQGPPQPAQPPIDVNAQKSLLDRATGITGDFGEKVSRLSRMVDSGATPQQVREQLREVIIRLADLRSLLEYARSLLP